MYLFPMFCIATDLSQSNAAKGEFHLAVISEARKNSTGGATNKLMVWVTTVLTSLRLFQEDVDTVSKGIMQGRVPVIRAQDHTGQWKRSRCVCL